MAKMGDRRHQTAPHRRMDRSRRRKRSRSRSLGRTTLSLKQSLTASWVRLMTPTRRWAMDDDEYGAPGSLIPLTDEQWRAAVLLGIKAITLTLGSISRRLEVL